MWLGYACSLLFVISYHWHPPLHIHIYTCQIWHLYPLGRDKVLSPLLESLTKLSHLVCLQATWVGLPLNVNEVCFGLRREVLLLNPLHLSPDLQLEMETKTMDHFHDMWESLLFQWLPGRQPLPSLFGAFGSITMGAHLMWSPHLTSRLSSPGPDGWRDRADERGRRLL